MKGNSIEKWRGDDTKTYPQLNARETEQFWTIIWQPRDYYNKAE